MTKYYGKFVFLNHIGFESLMPESIKNGKEKYRYILKKADDLGEHNPLADNAYFAFAFVAAWLGCDRALTPNQMGNVMDDVLHDVRFLFCFTDLNKESHILKFKKRMEKYERWQNENLSKYPTSWNLHIDEVKKGFSYHFTSCPIANLMLVIRICLNRMEF